MTLRQLSGQDAMFLYLDNPRASAHGTLIYIYDQSTAPKGLVRFKQILRHIEANLDLAPFFRKKLMRVPLELDYPYLVDDHEFDLNYHVRHIALPIPAYETRPPSLGCHGICRVRDQAIHHLLEHK